MRLLGIHHVAAIAANREFVETFYGATLGLEQGRVAATSDDRPLEFLAPDGSALHVYVRPEERPGRTGHGGIYRVIWRVGSPAALDHWSKRLPALGTPVIAFRSTRRRRPALHFCDPDGVQHELIADPDAAGLGDGADRHAILGIAGVRAYARNPVPTGDLLAGRLGFTGLSERNLALGDGPSRVEYRIDVPLRPRRARPGTGTIHHVAWACAPGDEAAWRQRVIGMGARVTRARRGHTGSSIYFREPSGVLFEVKPVASTDAGRRLAEAAPAPPTTELRLPLPLTAA
ncbi:MAG TPA: hypothetical protein VIL04_12025 [Solirubrobacterales bacterium]|jgi:glyoxalase family protein